MPFNITFGSSPQLDVSFGSSPQLDVPFGSVTEVPVTDYFDGEYEYTPTDTEQTIPIIGLTARRNITINPIPSNYGKITWNGAVMTVS